MEPEQQTRKASESLRVGLVLAFVGGYVDVYTYLCRGGVFANAQTGNMVLLGINLARGQIKNALGYLLPILAFCAGVLLAEAVRHRARKKPGRLHWRQSILLAEAAVLALVALLPGGGWFDALANLSVSFMCSLQVESFRRIHGQAYATTMCTGNLRSGTELMYLALWQKQPGALAHAGRYFSVILVFILGGIASCLLAGPLGLWSVLVACGGLLIVLALLRGKA